LEGRGFQPRRSNPPLTRLQPLRGDADVTAITILRALMIHPVLNDAG